MRSTCGLVAERQIDDRSVGARQYRGRSGEGEGRRHIGN
jgi:hypothetical protein